MVYFASNKPANSKPLFTSNHSNHMKKFIAMALVMVLHYVTAQGQTPQINFTFNEANGTATALESNSGVPVPVKNNFNKPERVPGIVGNALRLDGFSTWVEGINTFNYSGSLAFETWIILESYPADDEKPYAELTPSAIVSQFDGTNGFQLGMNTFGVWWFKVNVNGTIYTVQAPNLFPLYQWVHVVVVVDTGAGNMKLFLNGSQVAITTIPAGGQINESAVPFLIGKANNDKYLAHFLVNAMNGTIDETRMYSSALTPTEVTARYNLGSTRALTLGMKSIDVPGSRFANDIQRPIFHGMPPANWTNEPHGLVKHSGKYHLFYQRTPNGPFKQQMNWGHMVSADLVNWSHMRDAMRPEIAWPSTSGTDMKGIWSGDVILNGNTAYALYTSVNHSSSFNPGISVATSTDQNLEYWNKLGPKLDKWIANDMRDPFVWNYNGTWYLIVGSAYNGYGGLAYYRSTDLINWTENGLFTNSDYNIMNASIGSEIWEMPVFENMGGNKWALIVNGIGGSAGRPRAKYWTGSYSGGQFILDSTTPKDLDLFHGLLSPTTERDYNNQLVGIGIVDERISSEGQLKNGWCHIFNLPRVMYLMPDGRTIGQKALPDLTKIRNTASLKTFSNVAVSTKTHTLAGAAGKHIEIIAQVSGTPATRYGVSFRATAARDEIVTVYYDKVQKKIYFDKTKSSTATDFGENALLEASYDEAVFGLPTKFHIFADGSAVDIFINDAAAFSNRIYPVITTSDNIELYSDGGTTTFSSVQVWNINRAVPLDASVQGITKSVSLDKTSMHLEVGLAYPLTATVIPTSAYNQRVTWTSSNAGIAKVDNTGIVTGVASGTATITARTVDGNFAATCTATVRSANTTMKIYNFENQSYGDMIMTNAGQAFTTAHISNVSTYWTNPVRNFEKQGTWHCWGFATNSDAPTGSIRTPNFVLGGNGKVTLLIGGGNDIDKEYAALVNASNDQIIARVTGKNDEMYRKVTLDGTGYTGLSCYLKVVDNSAGGWGHINIDDIQIPVRTTNVAATGITLSASSFNLTAGQTARVNPTLSPLTTTNRTIFWTSNNPAVATVGGDGFVTAVSEGVATITARTQSGNFTATCSVYVVATPYLLYDFENQSFGNLTVTGNAFVLSDISNASTYWNPARSFNKQGTYHCWSFLGAGGDSDTGTLQTPNFILGGDGRISVLVSGGYDPANLYVGLFTSAGVLVGKVYGNNDEAYQRLVIEAPAQVGTSCYVKVVDTSTGGFGHINIDDLKIPMIRTSIVSGATYKILARHSGKALDVDGSVNVLADGTNIQQWDYLGVTNQKWIVTAVTGGYYKIRSVASNKILEIDSASLSNGGQAQQWTDFNYNHQQWSITPVSGSNGYFTITNRNSSKVLDIDASSMANGAKVQQWTPGGFTHQQFQLVRVDGGDVFMAETEELEREVLPENTFDSGTAYPNPFSHSVLIPFHIQQTETVAVDIYNASGIRIHTITKELEQGNHTLEWNGQTSAGHDAGTGVYVYKVYSNGKVKTGRVLKISE
jgi:sucrose-6-phosphate hydrolase SacC (GH32 family)